MKLSFYGAAHEVTGSCHLLEIAGKKILVDCGMFQGSNFNEGKNHDPFPFDPSEIDAVLVTHAHLDHTGRIPKLIKDGYKGQIYMTKATCGLAYIIWQDAYNIMTYNNRKFQTPVLYSEADVEAAHERCIGFDYNEELDLGGVKVVFKDAGHIFGAAFIEVTGEDRTVAFSGDIGNSNVPILRETDQLGKIDFLVCESTYGDRLHESRKESRELFLKLIKEGVEKGGTIMVPAFSLERTQEILYDLNQMSLYEKNLPEIPIFLDSPMAIRAIEVYKKYPEYYDRQATCLHEAGDDFFQFPGLTMTLEKEESKKINDIPGPKMVIAGSGMMNGGRIIHHAFRYLSDPNSTLIIVGYQAQGTLGRRLYEGAERVRVFDQDIDVKCTIKAIGGLSAHGDSEKIISWVRNAEKMPEKIYFVHGEPHSATALAHKFRDELDIKSVVPEFGDTAEL